eukprot:4101415-Pleurochrysis_carterae.AAC.2
MQQCVEHARPSDQHNPNGKRLGRSTRAARVDRQRAGGTVSLAGVHGRGESGGTGKGARALSLVMNICTATSATLRT